ncbi:hypothetical protein GCM10023321_79300 [Pseudonocardia eucalypti]|uniref:Uncharacterized protein n=1 Tax=Pseudonocardia eucalypti TaxID=648755 RepID=A0ABP9RD44_9PSEU|nr:hypothetical protein [Pseudonocardia eucalypti]
MAKERVADVNRTHARIRVTQAEKDAAELLAELAEKNGQAVDPVVQAIAKAKPRIA